MGYRFGIRFYGIKVWDPHLRDIDLGSGVGDIGLGLGFWDIGLGSGFGIQVWDWVWG